ncbi:MAG: hypothetical protein ABSA10_05505, partial [Anaerolineales bacterium]
DDVAETIAEKILKDFDGLDDESALQNAANRIFRKRCGRKSNARGEVLAISKACLSKVLYLEVDKLHCTTRQIEDRIFAGHTASPACYLVERYYKKAPVRGLLLLAAYTILEAGKINPVGIKGLEILTCTEEGIRRLRDDEIASLTALSESLDSQISQSLFPTARL